MVTVYGVLSSGFDVMGPSKGGRGVVGVDHHGHGGAGLLGEDGFRYAGADPPFRDGGAWFPPEVTPLDVYALTEQPSDSSSEVFGSFFR